MKHLSAAQRLLVWLLPVAAAVAGLGLGLWYLNPDRPAAGDATKNATVLPQPRPLPAVELVTAGGEAFSREGFNGDWHLLFFGFTHCPDVCPNTLGLLDGVDDLIRQRGTQPPRIVFVSVDPRRDDPATLRKYLTYFNEDFIGVTGPVAEIRQLTAALYIPFSYIGDVESGDYTVDHSGALVLVDPQGRARAYFTPPHDPQALATDLQALTAG